MPTQHIEITHPNNVNLKLAFHKVASFHPHYLTFTLQTYHHPVHRLRSWPTQTTSQSHPHTQVRVQPRNIYNHTYIQFCMDKTKQPLTKSRQNNLHSVHTRPCRIYEQSGPNNKQQSTTHGNAPKGSGSYLRPKTHIQRTHPQHLSTSTQTSTIHKSTHHHHHHSCRSHATKTAFISSTTLRCLSIHLAVAPEISTSWYQYPFSLGFF